MKRLRPKQREARRAFLARKPLYGIWTLMKQRCFNPKNDGFANYGGRGISVCEQWRTNFETFARDVGPRPSPEHSLDRFPNGDGNYEPGNVRWATRQEQSRNKRANVHLTYNGQTRCISEWAERMGVTPALLHKRISLGWLIDRVLNAPVRKQENFVTYEGRTQNAMTWCRELGLDYHRTVQRLRRGWSPERAFTA